MIFITIIKYSYSSNKQQNFAWPCETQQNKSNKQLKYSSREDKMGFWLQKYK